MTTIFEDRFAKAGWNQKRFEARAIIMNLMKGGLSLTELIEIGREVNETLSEGQRQVALVECQHGDADAQHLKSDEGQSDCASDGQTGIADVRPLLPEGQGARVQTDRISIADGQSFASGEARCLLPDRANEEVPPARDPISPIRDEGQVDVIREDHESYADVPNPIPREGQEIVASKGQLADADAGNPIASGKAIPGLPAKAPLNVPPAREPTPIRGPSPAQRAAALRAGHTSVASIFDRKLTDNTRVGELWSDQLPRQVSGHLREAAFKLQLKNYGIPPKPMQIKDYIPAEFVAKAWKESFSLDVTSVLGEGILLSPEGKLSFVKRSA